MPFNKNDIEKIILESAQKIKNYIPETKDYLNLTNFPLNQNQCLYVVNWQNSTVPIQIQVNKILGYQSNEFDLNTILNLPHPDDKEIVLRVSKGVIEHALSFSTIKRENSSHTISFRFLKKDGTYIKLLRQSSIFEYAKNGTMISNISLLTDISFMDKSNKVNWEVNTTELNFEEFKKNIYKEFVNFFTNRELEIIQLIFKNLTTAQIAEKLFISTDTVSTHRKNINKKSNCSNSQELVQFCQNIGVL